MNDLSIHSSNWYKKLICFSLMNVESTDDVKIVSYHWEEIKGPLREQKASADTPVLHLSNLVPGNYTFRYLHDDFLGGLSVTVEAMFVVQGASVKIAPFSELFNLKSSLYRGRLPTDPAWVLWLPGLPTSQGIMYQYSISRMLKPAYIYVNCGALHKFHQKFYSFYFNSLVFTGIVPYQTVAEISVIFFFLY